MWDLPGSGLEPVSVALAGGFLTTAPPGKPALSNFLAVTHVAGHNAIPWLSFPVCQAF